MRTLKLTTPNMTGADVAAWQRFLIAQGKLTGSADGVFGRNTDAATRAYQRSRGLGEDGVVGQVTLSQAVRDGFTGPNGLMIAGMDASTDCSSFAGTIFGERMLFVMRYYSLTASKAMRQAEAVHLSTAGFRLGVVYQDKNNDVDLFDEDTGREQATAALDQARGVGQPPGSAIFFAVDCNPNPAQARGVITEYFTAVNAVFAEQAAPYRIGVYGSGLTCRLIRDMGLATFTWLCGSASYQETMSFRTQADIVQIAPARNIGVAPHQLNVDDDIAQSADFGAFRLPSAQAVTST